MCPALVPHRTRLCHQGKHKEMLSAGESAMAQTKVAAKDRNVHVQAGTA